MKFINFPCYVPFSEYENVINRMVKKLSNQLGIISIYQIGNITDPGISDIDLLAVFKEGTKCHFNPIKDLSKSERFLFSHNLYGTSKTFFYKAQRYTFFHNYKLHWGKDLSIRDNELSRRDIQALKTQIALEYLIRMYISMTVKKIYGIFSIVGLLRHVNALSYDLEFLNTSSGKLYDHIESMRSWRNSWFDNKIGNQKLSTWIDDFYEELKKFLESILQKKKFYLPKWANFDISRNIALSLSEKFGYVHKGITLPPIFGKLGKKYFNIQNRFNKFQFYFPITLQKIPYILEKRFLFIKDMKTQNYTNFPHFIPLASSLNIF